MSTMGAFRTAIHIESVGCRGILRAVEDALVDTGSELTWVPRHILEHLGIRPEMVRRFVVADGRHLERQVGNAIVHAAGTLAPDDVVFADPGDTIILGARSRERLNLRVDAQRKQLIPAGPILAGAASSVRGDPLPKLSEQGRRHLEWERYTRLTRRRERQPQF